VSNLEHVEQAPGFEELGLYAFTTTRTLGSFSLNGAEPAGDVTVRWLGILEALADRTTRLVYAPQVHQDHILEHSAGWRGWLRAPEADGHFAADEPTAMAVTLADCVPVFLGHASGVAAVVHSGWKGTAARITTRAIAKFGALGLPAGELTVHCGPSICGRCYEVGPDVAARLTGTRSEGPVHVDLRALIARQAAESGVKRVSISASCTKCDNDQFFSHRNGDDGRQIGVIVSRARSG
jgi:polyphenol oxidase